MLPTHTVHYNEFFWDLQQKRKHGFPQNTYIILEFIKKGNAFMSNCRNNAMPYNNYRTMHTPAPMMRRDVWNDKALAMAYVPWQTWRDIYEVEKALHHGTIFCELDKPFLGRGGVKR